FLSEEEQLLAISLMAVPCDHGQEGGLSTSIGADQLPKLTRSNLPMDLFQNASPFKTHRYPVEMDQGPGRPFFLMYGWGQDPCEGALWFLPVLQEFLDRGVAVQPIGLKEEESIGTGQHI